MILELNNVLLIPKLLTLAKSVPDVPLDVLENMLLEAIPDKQSKIYIDDHEERVRGFIFGSKETWQGEKVVFIQFCVVEDSGAHKFICFELLTKLRLWARENEIKTLIMSTKRNPKSYIRKYKFTLEGYILKKEA